MRTLLMFFILLFSFLPFAQPVQANFDNGFDGPGFVGYSLNLTADGQINYTAYSNAHFDVYVTTYPDNSNKFLHNQSFGYIQSVSVINTTYAAVQGSLPAGQYVVWVQSHEQGRVHWSGVDAIGPSQSLSIPWDIVATIAIAAIVTVIGTHMVLKRYRRI